MTVGTEMAREAFWMWHLTGEGLVLNGEREPDMQKPSKGIQELPKKC